MGLMQISTFLKGVKFTKFTNKQWHTEVRQRNSVISVSRFCGTSGATPPLSCAATVSWAHSLAQNGIVWTLWNRWHITRGQCNKTHYNKRDNRPVSPMRCHTMTGGPLALVQSQNICPTSRLGVWTIAKMREVTRKIRLRTFWAYKHIHRNSINMILFHAILSYSQ